MKILKGILLGIAVLYVLVFILLIIFQEQMIFMSESLPKDYQYEFPTRFEEIDLSAPDGSSLNALYFKSGNPEGIVLYFHGNAGELASWGLVVQKFVERNYDVLIMDYRGYGKSTGPRAEDALYADAATFYDYVSERYKEDRIVVYGRSLGTAFATYVAAKNKPRELILEAPFYSLGEVARNRFRIFPVGWFLEYNFPTYRYIGEVQCPITIFHGMDDTMVRYQNSLKLSELVPPDQLNLISIPEGRHNDLEVTPEYRRTLDSIL